MGEIAVNFLLERLATFSVKEAQLLGGVRQEIEGIMEELESIQAFLKDADRKADSSEGIKTWVRQVRRVAYDVEDLIDEFMLRCGRRHGGHGIMNFLYALFSAMKQLPATYRLAKNIQAIERKITEISERRGKYDIQKIEEDSTLDATIRRWQDYGGNIVAEADVVGIEKDVNLLMEKLVGVTGKDPKTCYKFISVVGMGGLGKTTLVRKVYKEPKVKAHFDCSAWVSVSQSFNAKDLVKNVLIEFRKTNKSNVPDEEIEKIDADKLRDEEIEKMDADKLRDEEIEKMDADKLRTEVQKHLQGKRFLLVLDDVWERTVWDLISCALPMNPNGSKIMITTRIKSVAVALGATENENFIHELKTLREDEAKVLLCLKVFGRNAMPLEFEEVCKAMLQRCRGLPLAIVVLGGILRNKKTVLEWEKVNHDLAWLLGHEYTSGGSIASILKLSYNELPLYLKPCFLYCSLFPEDHLIKRNRLVRLWVAEGFIEERSERTMEEVGEDYLMQLIDRSMLQVEDTNFDGSRVRWCRIHDLMHDLAVTISQEDEFSFKLDKQVRKQNVLVKPRRMSVIEVDKEIGEIDHENVISNRMSIQLRSLLVFNVHKYVRTHDHLIPYSGFKLLRVLDLEGSGMQNLSKTIGQLLHLRCLNLKGNRDLHQLPGTIERLQNLETLDIRDTWIRKLPIGIVMLKKLRHLCMDRKTKVPKGSGNLRCLQTLTGVCSSGAGIAAEMGNLKELRRLDIFGVKEEDAEEVYASLREMNHLFRLRIVHSRVLGHRHTNFPFGKRLFEHPPPNLRILRLRRLSQLPDTLGSFNSLIRLTLSKGFLSADPFPCLSSLPSLTDLHLTKFSHINTLACGSKGFPKLKRLILERLGGLEMLTFEKGGMPSLESLQLKFLWGLKTVRFEKGSMPSLKRMVMNGCPKLQMVPQGIQHLELQELALEFMPKDFVRRLKEGGEDRSKVQHIPSITLPVLSW